MNFLPRIAITSGEPAGIGPDIILQAAQHNFSAELIVIASAELLKQRAKALKLPIKIFPYDQNYVGSSHQSGSVVVANIDLDSSVTPGKLEPKNVPYVLQTLERAAQGCLHQEFHAVVTAPIHKGCINDAGIAFTGHTEFFSELAKAPVVMMLVADTLRVALVTTHLPLQQVSAAITPAHLEQTLRILHHDLQMYFQLTTPRILVTGLNPHAGEQGYLGREEIEVITPVIEKLSREGMQLQGPLPADTIFTPRYLQQADAILTMYHDQGLPVLKYAGFGHAVNVTLGLPFIRTSVDHGTALDLAGSKRADAGSLIAAIELASALARYNKNI